METISELNIHVVEIKKAGMLYRALNHDLRQDILHLIHNAGKITVTELYHKLHLEQSVASQHLAILRRAGFVIAERNMRFVFYRINYDAIRFIEEKSKALLG